MQRKSPTQPHGELLERAKRSHVATAVFAACLAVYLLTAPPLLPHHIDPLTNTLTAWNVANQGSFYLDRWESVTGPDFNNQSNQLVTGRNRAVSKYPPGAALFAAPLYMVFDQLHPAAVMYVTADGETGTTPMDLPELWPSVLVGSLSTSGAVAVMFLVFDAHIGRRRALTAATALALGTSFWTISAHALWQHGPAALMIAAGLWALHNDWIWIAGVMWSPLLLIRPQVAIAIGVAGLSLAFFRRSLDPMLAVGVPSFVAMSLYLGFNSWIFGETLPTSAGGYAVSVSGPVDGRIKALTRGLFDPSRGLFVYSPYTALAVPAWTRSWRSLPDWSGAAALGGLVLFVFQLRSGDFSGGTGFFGYRYPLESLVLASPAMAIAISAWVAHVDWRRWLSIATVGLAVALHAGGAMQ